MTVTEPRRTVLPNLVKVPEPWFDRIPRAEELCNEGPTLTVDQTPGSALELPTAVPVMSSTASNTHADMINGITTFFRRCPQCSREASYISGTLPTLPNTCGCGYEFWKKISRYDIARGHEQ